MTVTLAIEMLSDWHVGSGQGDHGSVDSTVLKDHLGFPVIPASTLKGILRDAAEQVAYALDNGKSDGPWNIAVKQLFGSQPVIEKASATPPLQGALGFREAGLTPGLKDELTKKKVVSAVTFTKSGVKIDRDSGTAAAKQLRSEEVARKGALLTTEISLPQAGNDDTDKVIRALLAAAAELASSLGGKRRRGLGQCKITLSGMSASDAADILETASPPDIDRSASPHGAAPVYGDGMSGGFRRFALDVMVESPVIAGGRVEANVVTSDSFISGQLLLPAIARMLREAKPGMEADINRAISAGNIRVLPAYLRIKDRRSLPTPLGYQTLKAPKAEAETSRLFCTLHEGTATATDQGGSNTQRKDLRGGYSIQTKDGLERIAAPATTFHTHNAIDDDWQRPTSDVVGVFVYEAIAAHQQFLGEVMIARDSGLDGLKFKPIGLQLGRGKGRGYGHVKLSIDRTELKASSSKKKSKGDTLYVLFESDTILLDGNLQPVTSLRGIADCIARAMGLTSAVFKLESSRAITRTRSLEGWTSAWNLPRQAQAAIEAGSAVALSVDGDIDAAQLDKLAKDGLGIRKSEGFGRISLDPEMLAKPSFTLIRLELQNPGLKVVASQHSANAQNGKEAKFVESVTMAAWKAWVEKSAETLAVADSKEFKWLREAGAEGRKIRTALDLLAGNIDLRIEAEADEATEKRPKDKIAKTLKELKALRDKIEATLKGAKVPAPTGNLPPALDLEATQTLALTLIQVAHRKGSQEKTTPNG